MATEHISGKTAAKGLAAAVILAASLGICKVGDYNINGIPDGYIPGTYTASAAGIQSDVVVNVTFDESGMVEITADVSGETPGLGTEIAPEMTDRILSAQNTVVDGVAGSTVTSDAFKAAVEDCILQATGEKE